MAIKEIRFWNGGGVMSNVTRQKELETKEIGQYRKALLSNVNGRILELGIGKGTNLLYYPRSVHKIVGVDHSLKKLCRSIPETEHYYVDYNHLPFEDDSFDNRPENLQLLTVGDNLKRRFESGEEAQVKQWGPSR